MNKIAKLLVKENDIKYIETLKDKSLEDFNTFKIKLKDQIKHFEQSIVKTASSILTLIDECGLEYSDFSNSYLPKYFTALTNKNHSVNFGLEP